LVSSIFCCILVVLIENKVMKHQELKELAIEIHDGRVFTDRHCHTAQAVQSSFMILSLGGLSVLRKRDRENIGLIYEYLSASGPMAVNGNPIFTSMRRLTKKQTEKMFEYYNEYHTLQEQFKGG
jgi:hypothetical protein